MGHCRMFNIYSYFWANEFLQSYHHTYIGSLLLNQNNKNIISGSGVNTKSFESISSAIGEFYERNLLFEFIKNIDKKGIMTGANMRTGQIRSLTKKEIERKQLFKDSCGLATHVESEKCIMNAFNEFLERQSFVFNYLSKGMAEKISFDICSSYVEIPEMLKEIKVYNISLSSQYFVILIIADKGTDGVWIGLGSDFKFEKALKKALKEIYQYYLMIRCESQNHSNIKKLPGLNSYTEIYEALTREQVLQAYSYLDNAPNMKMIDDKADDLYLQNILNELWEKYQIDPYIFWANLNSNVNIKACYICDLNWFPSMFPKFFVKEHYDFVEKVTKTKLERKCTFIPFP